MGFFLSVDRRDWDAVRTAFADVVDTDYTSLGAGAPERLDPDVLIERWQGLLPGFDVTQHHLGPVGVLGGEGDHLVLGATVRAHHRIDEQEWLVAGSYTLVLDRAPDGWRISGLTLHTAYVDGRLDLPAVAAERAARAA